MYHGNGGIHIERAANGYVVCYRDPEIEKYNNSRGMDSKKPYKDPEKEYVFKTSDEVVAFIKKAIDKMLPMDDDEVFNDEFKRRAE